METEAQVHRKMIVIAFIFWGVPLIAAVALALWLGGGDAF